MTHAPAAKKRVQDDDEGDSEADSTPPPPDGGWGWVIVWASFMIHIVTDGVTYSFGVLLRQLVTYFDAGEGATSLIMSILVGVTLCSGPIASALVNKWGCRAVTIAGAILSGICLAVSFFAQNLATLYVTIGLGTGFGFGLIYLPAIVSVTCYFEKYRSLATGIAVCGSGLGTFIFAPFIEYLTIEYGGWRGTMLILAGLALNTAIMGALFRPLEVPKKRASIEMKDMRNCKTELQQLLNGQLKEEQSPYLVVPQTADQQVQSAHSIPAAVAANGDAVKPRSSLGHHTVPRNVKVLSLNLSVTPHQILGPSNHSHHHHHHHPHANHHHHHHSSGRHKGDIARLAASQPSLQTHAGSVAHLAGSGVMYRKDVFYRGSLVNIAQHSLSRGPSLSRSEASQASQASRASLCVICTAPQSRSAPQSFRRHRSFARPGSANAAFDISDEDLLPPTVSKRKAGGGRYSMSQSREVRSAEYRQPPATLLSNSRLSRHTSNAKLEDGCVPGLIGGSGVLARLQPDASPDSDTEERLTICGCIPCSPETKDTLAEMLDMSLFKDTIFILFTVSNFLTSIGFYMPYAYLKAYGEAQKIGLEPIHASYLVSVIGAANTVGRVILGYAADKPWVNRLLVYNLSLTIAGVATVLVVVCNDFWSLAVYASVFGFSIGAYVGLTSVILVDLLGLDKLTNAFGLLLLFQGIASLLGPPIGGWLYDATQSYEPSFWVAGVAMAVSGAMLFVVPPLQRRIEAKKRLSQKQVPSAVASNGSALPQLV